MRRATAASSAPAATATSSTGAARARGGRMHVRVAAERDLEALGRLWTEADELHARLSPGFFRRPDASRGRQRAAEALRDAGDSEHETILVVLGREDGKETVCGAVHLQIYDTPVGHTMVSQRRGHVETLIVARAQRRRGFGRALMQAATDWVKRRGAEQLLLTVWAGNADAERFYAALGYRTISQVLGTDL